MHPLGLARALRVAVPFGVALFVALWIGGTRVFAEPGPLRARAMDTVGGDPVAEPVRLGVVLVPVGPSSRVDAQALARELRTRYRIPVTTRPRIELAARTFDDRRHQLVADELVGVLERSYPASGSGVVIGITDYDMESTSLGFQHMFAFRLSQHYAVVSSAQVGANGFDRLRGHSRHERVRKLVARELAFLYLGKPQSDDPQSLVGSMLWRLHDIDRMRERL